MDTQPQQATPILQIAWTRYAQLDAYSKKRTKAHINSRRWISILSVVATFLAILTTFIPDESPTLLSVSLKFFLILTPILGSALAAFGSKFLSSGDWLIARAGAEEILKEIYNYRTVLANTPTRRAWLEKRLAEIQRSMFRGMNGELTMPPYNGPIPPNYSPSDPASDPGFNDLNGDEYFKHRLEAQLNWHVGRVNKRQVERTRLQIFIILSGVFGALLAVFLPLWTALAASFTAVFIGWQELRNFDSVVRNYSKVIMELNILNDHWKNLEPEEKSSTEFFEIVRSTEEILWGQNVEYIKAMQEALKNSDLEEEAGLVNRVIKAARESDRRLKQAMEDSVVEFTSEKLSQAEETLSETFETALNTLAEEASSDLVRAELEAMQRGLQERFADIKSTLAEIAEDFAGVEIGANTPPAVLNSLLARYPKSQEPKG
ncbi:MAG: SLATT domain-containing protein [Anaerolineales bacterium]|nr:SLATT domain-containing protein [Anaerolineales bacterium]